jgi:aspartate kinase
MRRVFQIFEEHRTPIDMITTSEVAVALTIDNDEHLENIVERLGELGTIEVERNNSIVCIVGDLDYRRAGLLCRIADSLHDIPVKMLSYGASNRNLVLLVDTCHKAEALRCLNHELFGL